MQSPMRRFEDKVCIVSGGASGIGLATCERLSEEGAKVAIVDLNFEGAKEAAESLKKKGGTAQGFKADVSDEADVNRVVTDVVAQWGRVDVLVNDAAMMTFKPLTDLKLSDWERVLAVNLRSVFLFCHAAIPHMNGGSIVNVSSVHAHETTANVVPYASSKGGMEAFSRALSQEHPLAKLRINCVAPGAIDTPMLWNNPNVKSGAEKVSGKIGKPENVAAAICFLASDDAAFVNGTTLVVDGGRLDVL